MEFQIKNAQGGGLVRHMIDTGNGGDPRLLMTLANRVTAASASSASPQPVMYGIVSPETSRPIVAQAMCVAQSTMTSQAARS